MLQPENIPEMEERLRKAGRSVAELCAAANIDRSTWTRWKANETAPRFVTWMGVVSVFDGMASNPPKTSEADA